MSLCTSLRLRGTFVQADLPFVQLQSMVKAALSVTRSRGSAVTIANTPVLSVLRLLVSHTNEQHREASSVSLCVFYNEDVMEDSLKL